MPILKKTTIKGMIPWVTNYSSILACTNSVNLLFLIIWLQQYALSDWLLSEQDFLIMTGHYEKFCRLDGSFEL